MSQTHITETNTELAVWSFEDIKSTSNLYNPTIAEPVHNRDTNIYHYYIKIYCNKTLGCRRGTVRLCMPVGRCWKKITFFLLHMYLASPLGNHQLNVIKTFGVRKLESQATMQH